MVSDMATDSIKTRVHAFDANLLTRLGDENFTTNLPDHVFYLQDDDVSHHDSRTVADIPLGAEYRDMLQPDKPGADDMIEFETFNQYTGDEFLVNQNGESVPAKVTKGARNNYGKPIGKRNANPLLDTREYECVLDDGSVYRCNANVIAENIFAQCDGEHYF
jgi:hypothetical protein